LHLVAAHRKADFAATRGKGAFVALPVDLYDLGDVDEVAAVDAEEDLFGRRFSMDPKDISL